MSDWSEAELEAMARASSDCREVWAIELRHSTFEGGMLRYVAYGRPLALTHEPSAPLAAAQAVMYQDLAFQTRPPAISSQPGSSMEVSMMGIGGEAVRPLTVANQTPEVIAATVRSYDVNVLTHAVSQRLQVIHQQVRHISGDPSNLKLSLSRPNAANTAFPSVLHTPESNPGLIE